MSSAAATAAAAAAAPPPPPTSDEFFLHGHTNWLKAQIEHLLQNVLNTTDLSWAHGLNEAGLKALLVATLIPQLPPKFTLRSEVKVKSGRYCDLLIEGPNMVLIIELKHTPMDYITVHDAGTVGGGGSVKRKPLKTRDEMAAMSQWLVNKAGDEKTLRSLLVAPGGCKHTITVQQAVDDALRQCLRYASAIRAHKPATTTVIAIAMVGVGVRLAIESRKVL